MHGFLYGSLEYSILFLQYIPPSSIYRDVESGKRRLPALLTLQRLPGPVAQPQSIWISTQSCTATPHPGLSMLVLVLVWHMNLQLQTKSV